MTDGVLGRDANPIVELVKPIPLPKIQPQPREAGQRVGERSAVAIWYVGQGGSDGNTGLSWGQAFASPEVALAAAGPGDSVWIESGDYDTLDPANPDDSYTVPAGVSLLGGFSGATFGELETAPEQRSGPGWTRLLGADDGTRRTNHVGRIENASGVLLDRVEFSRGNARVMTSDPLSQYGGALLILNSQVTLRDVRFTDSRAVLGGAGLCTFQSDLTVEASAAGLPHSLSFASLQSDLSHANGQGSFGGAMLLLATTVDLAAQAVISNTGFANANYGGFLSIQDTTFTWETGARIVAPAGTQSAALSFDNGTTFGGFGGGVYVVLTDTTPVVEMPPLEIRQAVARAGGGVYVGNFANVPSELILGEYVCVRSVATLSGGAMYATGFPGMQVEIGQAQIEQCEAQFGGGLFTTAALRVLGGVLSQNDAPIGGTFFSDNTDPTPYSVLIQDTDVLMEGPFYGSSSLHHTGNGHLNLNRCRFESINGYGGDGGMLNTALDTRVRMENCLFTGHASGYPIQVGNDAEILANHVTIAGNSRVGSLLSGSSFDLVNSIIYNNNPQDDGFIAQSGANVSLQYCIAEFFNFSLPNVVTNVDPLLDPMSFEPLPGSPAIDVSTGSFPLFGDNLFDLLGNPRAIDDPGIADRGVPHLVYGVQADLGAFEFQSPVCKPDTNGDGILDNGDIITFVQLFLAGDIAVDFNSDGILDNGDIVAFVAAFLAGC